MDLVWEMQVLVKIRTHSQNGPAEFMRPIIKSVVHLALKIMVVECYVMISDCEKADAIRRAGIKGALHSLDPLGFIGC